MRRLAVLSVAVLMLSACAEKEAPPVELTATDVSALKVTDQREQLPATFATLSPDGRTVLYISDDHGTCVRGVDGSNEQCFDADFNPNNDLDPASASWSPDHRKLALTDEYGLGLEPDLRVLDLATGTLTNLTDDGVVSEGISLTGPPDFPAGAMVDVYPSWTADGKSIRFVRKDGQKTALMTVPAGGGSPTKVGMLDTDWGRLRNVAWAENSIAWVSGPPSGDVREVFVSSASGGEKRRLLAGDYWNLSFSADGAFLLANATESDTGPATDTARVVPVRGGKALPVASGGVTYPTWAPKGHALAYVEAAGTIKVVGKPGAKPRILFEEPGLAAAGRDSLVWRSGTLLVGIGEKTPVVLTVDG